MRRTLLMLALALAGIALTAAVTWGTSQLVRQRIGLASEPLNAGRRLLPSSASAPAARRPTKTVTRTVSTPSPTPVPPTVTPTPTPTQTVAPTSRTAPMQTPESSASSSGSESGDTSRRRDD